ncbi:uncharacterized protein [Typha angustifolia]|uniref:uncharacterized protein n=1 Tax=Typha angustifolia TaxID=59011 RepID=UPI003C2F0B58
MRLLRRIASIFGLAGDDHHEASGGDARGSGQEGGDRTVKIAPSQAPARAYSVQEPVAVDKPTTVRPIIVPCDLGDGGVQGFKWYTRRLRIDDEGDVADEFLYEIPSTISSTDNQIAPPKFQINYNTRPTVLAMRKQTVAIDGNIQQSLEYRGQLRWV